MGLSSLTGSISTEFKWTAQNDLTGEVYNPISNVGDIRLTANLSTSLDNNVSGGADEVFSFQQAVSAGSSATIDLTAMTNLLNQTSVSIVRVKGYQIRLLSATNDTTITTPVATAGLVTNNGVALPAALDFQAGGSGLTLALTTSGGAISSVAIGAAGSGYLKSSTFTVAPNQSGGAGGVVNVTTNASGVPTTVALVSGAGGSGYSDATVPTTVLGQYTINSGGAHCYFDPLAAGFLALSSTTKNIKLVNLDGTNTATFEIDVFGGTD